MCIFQVMFIKKIGVFCRNKVENLKVNINTSTSASQRETQSGVMDGHTGTACILHPE